jgi:pimeloyl-ACP methyl ester carboxylesterase
MDDLARRLSERGREAGGRTSPREAALTADAEAFYKGAVWALRYDTDLTAADVNLIRKFLARAEDRLEALEAGRRPWTQKKGRLVRAYVSEVDGSVQPYGLTIPAGYTPGRPMRLDVVLHGSSRPVGMSELRFMARFDEGDAGGSAPDVPYLQLEPLGRVENGYRWAGETDVFEAMEDVCRNYSVDRDRIVLRGMSMGASGTWHLGLKNPDRFVALGPYCGYVDTHRFSETPLPNFVKVGPLPEYQEKTLHLLDSVDYAANVGVVPEVAAIGDQDVFFQAHVIMGKAIEQEGLKMLNLISPGTGHMQDPKTHAEQMRLIGQHADRGLNHTPDHLRFVTWSLKYHRAHWLDVLGLDEQYRRSEIEARREAEGAIRVETPKNISRFAILPAALPGNQLRITVGGEPVTLPPGRSRAVPVVLERRGGEWIYAGSEPEAGQTGKRPGLQGPIDDAFTQPFLCVRGTGKPWSPAVQAWSDANLRRFAYEWNRYFRGDLPVKDDTAVTEEDLRTKNLILFGDPGSNRWIEQALPKLPVRWGRNELRVGAARYTATDHAPALICASPLPGASGHYLVLNSGHTFHEPELSTLNYLLFPRLGDFAVFQVGSAQPTSTSAPLDEKLLRAGLMDERWRIPVTGE